MEVKKNETSRTRPAARKTAYHAPRLTKIGDVAILTGKPGTRGDGAMGTTGDKGQGS